MNEATNVIRSNDVLRTLRQVSLVFFFLIGLSHILTGLFASNDIYLPTSNVINRVLDIPFALIGAVFGLSQARIASDSHLRKTYLALMAVILLLVLGIMLYITLFLPDKIS